MGDWREAAQERATQKSKGKNFKLAEGDNPFRIAPNAKGTKKRPYVEFRVHRDVGLDKRSCTCGYNIQGEGECWLCDVKIPELEQSGRRDKMMQAKAMRYKEQMLVQVFPITRKGKFMPAQPWYVPGSGGPKSLSVAILGTLASTRRSYDDPKKGYNLNIKRTGTGPRDTRYGQIEADDMPTRVPSSILSSVKPFSQILPRYDEDEIRAAYYGRNVDEVRKASQFNKEESEDDNYMPRGKKKAAPKGKKKAKADEQEQQEQQEQQENEQQQEQQENENEENTGLTAKEEKLLKKLLAKKKKSKSKDDENQQEQENQENQEQENQEQENENEENEKPKKKAKKKAKK